MPTRKHAMFKRKRNRLYAVPLSNGTALYCLVGQRDSLELVRLRNGTLRCYMYRWYGVVDPDSRLHNGTPRYSTGISIRNRTSWIFVRMIYSLPESRTSLDSWNLRSRDPISFLARANCRSPYCPNLLNSESVTRQYRLPALKANPCLHAWLLLVGWWVNPSPTRPLLGLISEAIISSQSYS